MAHALLLVIVRTASPTLVPTTDDVTAHHDVPLERNVVVHDDANAYDLVPVSVSLAGIDQGLSSYADPRGDVDQWRAERDDARGAVMGPKDNPSLQLARTPAVRSEGMYLTSSVIAEPIGGHIWVPGGSLDALGAQPLNAYGGMGRLVRDASGGEVRSGDVGTSFESRRGYRCRLP